MSYFYEFRKPSSTSPYLVIHAATGHAPPRGEPVPLGGNCEILRGEFCGNASLKINQPIPFEAGDRVRVWAILKNPLGTRSLYFGEIVSLPWFVGEGEIQCRSVFESLSKASWTGFIEDSFKNYLTEAFNRCAMPADVQIGFIPDVDATLSANTVRELFGDTVSAALPAAAGSSAGVGVDGKFGVYVPSTQTTIRFEFGESQISEAGDLSNYANAVRFSVTAPDGSKADYEVPVTSEIARRGQEIWEISGTPSPIALSPDNPLSGESGTVQYLLSSAGVEAPMTSINPLPWGSTSWGGHLNDALGGTPTWQAGANFFPATAVESAMTVEGIQAGIHVYLNQSPHSGEHGNAVVVADYDFECDLHGQTIANALDINVDERTGQAGGIIQLFQNGDWLTVRYFGPTEFGYPSSPLITVKYKQSFINAFQPHGIALKTPVSWFTTPPAFYAGAVDLYYAESGIYRDYEVKVGGKLGDQAQQSTLKVRLAGGGPSNTSDLLTAQAVTISKVRLPLSQPKTISSGGVIGIKADSGAVPALWVGDSTGMTALSRLPTDQNDQSGLIKFSYSGPTRTFDRIEVGYTLNKLGFIQMFVLDDLKLAEYGLGLLYNKMQPVRKWVGVKDGILPIPAEGYALFNVPGTAFVDGEIKTVWEDVTLEIQRVVYDFDAWQTRVECGTPMAATLPEQLRGNYLQLARQIRTATT